MFTFSKNLNLLSEDDLSTCFDELASAGYISLVASKAELRKLIEFGRTLLPASAFEIGAGMSSINVRRKMKIVYSFVEDILPIIRFLYGLRIDSDFVRRVKANLANPPQFDDTLFELKCLKHFLRNGFSFEYESEIVSGTKPKKPDFRLTKDGVELFCECKQVRIGQNKGELRFGGHCQYLRDNFAKELCQKLFDAKLRLEVDFKRTPSQVDLDELVSKINELCNDSQGIREVPPQQVGNSIEYLILLQSEPAQFPMRAVRNVTLIIGVDKPRLLHPDTNTPEGEICINSAALTKTRKATLSRLIREGKNQLPDDKMGIIIMGRIGLNIAIDRIQNRMNGPHYQNIIAFVVNPFDEDFWSCYRGPHYGDLLADLFEGFRPDNPFTSN